MQMGPSEMRMGPSGLRTANVFDSQGSMEAEGSGGNDFGRAKRGGAKRGGEGVSSL